MSKKEKTLGWNPTYFGEPKKGSLAAVISDITDKQNETVGGKPEVQSSVAAQAKEAAKNEQKYTISIETNKNDKSDDGDGLDAVQPKAVKKKFKDRKDKDIDNDGDVDDSDRFLHKRRKAISKAISKDEEGNAFGKAVMSAKEKGDKEFVFAGKKYKVEQEMKKMKEKEKAKSPIEVHGEKFEQGKQFKVQSMVDALKKVYAVKEGFNDDELRALCHTKDHDCATVIEHPQYGKGKPLHGSHAVPDANGFVEWYDVEFKHGVEKKIYAKDVNVLATEAHHKRDEGHAKMEKDMINAIKNMDDKKLEKMHAAYHKEMHH